MRHHTSELIGPDRERVPEPARRAIIDIGTNSIKLLIAEIRGGIVTPLLERSEQTRLGRGFYETRQLRAESIAHTAEVVAAFAKEAQSHQARFVRLIATSAARDARNQQELLSAIQNASGLPVEVISGEQEAHWVFQGVRTDPKFKQNGLFIMDVGGGSTEFILGESFEEQFHHSFNLGAVRLYESVQPADPPSQQDWSRCQEWLRAFFARQIHPVFSSFSPRIPISQMQLVGTGGTASILARIHLGLGRFDRHQMETAVLSRQAVQQQRQRLWSLALAERRKVAGMPAKRADIILTGAAIYESVMKEFGFDQLRISTRGLRFAAVLEKPGA